MEQTLEHYDLGSKDVNVENIKKKTNNAMKSNKCDQCDSAISHAGNLRRHMRTHSGKRLNKCSQCNYASSQASDLRTHLIQVLLGNI